MIMQSSLMICLLQIIKYPAKFNFQEDNCKEHPADLLVDFRESRAFLLCQVGGNEAEMQQKCEICRTLHADWMDALYT